MKHHLDDNEFQLKLHNVDVAITEALSQVQEAQHILIAELTATHRVKRLNEIYHLLNKIRIGSNALVEASEYTDKMQVIP